MRLKEERRKRTRTSADFEVRFEIVGHSGLARVRDISGSGVRCVFDRPIPLMMRVALILNLPSDHGPREISCCGAVVRSRALAVPGTDRSTAAFDTAIFFTEISDADRVEVEEYVSATGRPHGG